MKKELKLQKILSFLENYHDLWAVEILNNYPKLYNDEIEAYTSELQSLSLQEKASLLTNYQSSHVSKAFQDLLSQIKTLIEIPLFEKTVAPLKRKIKLKKTHEIAQILSFLKTKEKKEQYYDFAGGIGHLSRALCHEFDASSTCLDHDPTLIKNAKEFPESKAHYSLFTIGPNMQLNLLTNSRLVGLHCCGELTDHIIDYYIKNSKNNSLLSLGCCFHKINEHSLFSNHALHLATHAHKHTNKEDLEKRERVKRLRYSFELFLKEELSMKETSILKSSVPETYQKSFSEYATDQMLKLGITPPSHQKLNSFYQSEITQEKVTRMIHLGYLRLCFGRLIEIAIVLQRALKIPGSEVIQLFDRKISPRNIAIFR